MFRYLVPNPLSTPEKQLPPVKLNRVAKSATHVFDVLNISATVSLTFTKCLPGYIDGPLLLNSIRRKFLDDYYPMDESDANEISAGFAVMDGVAANPDTLRHLSSRLSHSRYLTNGWEQRVATIMMRTNPQTAWSGVFTKIKNNILFDAVLFTLTNKLVQDLPRDMIMAATPGTIYLLDFNRKVVKQIPLAELSSHSGNEKNILMTVRDDGDGVTLRLALVTIANRCYLNVLMVMMLLTSYHTWQR